MWTVENRARYDRGKLRYPSDLTDDEWALARPEIPRAKRRGVGETARLLKISAAKLSEVRRSMMVADIDA